MTSLSTLRQKCRDEYIKIDRTGKVRSDTVLDAMINRAYDKIQQDARYSLRENDAESAISIVNNTATLPSDFILLDDLVYGNISLNRVEKQEMYSAAASTPSTYYIRGSVMGFDSPSGTVTLYYRKRLPTLTDVQDTAIPSDFDDAIASHVKYEGFMSVGKEQQASMHLADYEMQKASLLATYLFYDNNKTWN